MKYAPYSFSKMGSFEHCPRKFYLTYIQKIKLPFTSNFALKKGSFIHDMIEKDLQRLPLPVLKENIGTKAEVQKLKKLISEFREFNFYKKMKRTYGNAEKSHVEDGIGFDEDWTPVSYKDAVIFRGYIDLYLLKNKSAIIIDHKSGKFKEVQDFSQNEIYSLWVMKKYPEVESVYLMFNYLEHDLSNQKIVTRADIPTIQKKFVDRIEKIESEKNFDKHVTKLCNWCDFLHQGHCHLTDKELLSVL